MKENDEVDERCDIDEFQEAPRGYPATAPVEAESELKESALHSQRGEGVGRAYEESDTNELRGGIEIVLAGAKQRRVYTTWATRQSRVCMRDFVLQLADGGDKPTLAKVTAVRARGVTRAWHVSLDVRLCSHHPYLEQQRGLTPQSMDNFAALLTLQSGDSRPAARLCAVRCPDQRPCKHARSVARASPALIGHLTTRCSVCRPPGVLKRRLLVDCGHEDGEC